MNEKYGRVHAQSYIVVLYSEIIIIIIIMRQVMAYKCSYKLPIYMGKIYKGWKGHV